MAIGNGNSRSGKGLAFGMPANSATAIGLRRVGVVGSTAKMNFGLLFGVVRVRKNNGIVFGLVKAGAVRLGTRLSM